MTIIDTIRKDAGKAKWVGILMLIAGFISLLSPFISGLSITVIIGVQMKIGGVGQLFLVFGAGSIGQGVLVALLALLYVLAGGYMMTQPLSAMATLTLFIAAYFVVSGVAEAIGAFNAKPADGWGWLLIGGLVSVLLGGMIWSQFPVSGIWALGTLVGVRLLTSGGMLIAISSAVREATGEDEHA